jgi:hypothetical protein
MEINHTITFDRQEYEVLKRVVPSIPIAFPTHELWKTARETGKKITDVKREAKWPGRHLTAVCSQMGGAFSRNQIEGALDALAALIAVLEQESHVEYWRDQLCAEGEQGGTTQTSPSVFVIASAEGMCIVLAEARQVQLREAREALDLLRQAVEAVR